MVCVRGARPTSWIDGGELSDARFTATGPSALPCRFQLGTSRMWGIGLLRLGWARFIEADAFEFANTVFDGATHPAFARFDCMADALCDPALGPADQLSLIYETMGQLMRPCRDEPKIMRVHAALVSGEHIAVADLASSCGMSIRTLERVCHRYFGFTPKRLLRRQRFMRSLSSFMLHQARGEQGRWTEAMDGEYHDQAQFTREFTEFMTMTPSKYAALEHPILSPFMDARARIWGSAAQTLDQPRRGFCSATLFIGLGLGDLPSALFELRRDVGTARTEFARVQSRDDLPGGGERLVFSGDLGRQHDLLMPPPQPVFSMRVGRGMCPPSRNSSSTE